MSGEAATTGQATVDIAIASADDAASIAILARDTFVAAFAASNTPGNMALYVDKAFSEDKVRDELGDSAATFFCAEKDGTPAGYAKLYRDAAQVCVTGTRKVELQRIYVAPASIGSGVGLMLLHSCIKMARQEGFETLWLGVWEHNDRAIAFYRNHGFVDVGKQTFWLGTDQQTDRVMQLELRR